MKCGFSHSYSLIDSALSGKMNSGSSAKSSASATRVTFTFPTRHTFVVLMVIAFLRWADREESLQLSTTVRRRAQCLLWLLRLFGASVSGSSRRPFGELVLSLHGHGA